METIAKKCKCCDTAVITNVDKTQKNWHCHIKRVCPDCIIYNRKMYKKKYAQINNIKKIRSRDYRCIQCGAPCTQANKYCKYCYIMPDAISKLENKHIYDLADKIASGETQISIREIRILYGNKAVKLIDAALEANKRKHKIEEWEYLDLTKRNTLKLF